MRFAETTARTDQFPGSELYVTNARREGKGGAARARPLGRGWQLPAGVAGTLLSNVVAARRLRRTRSLAARIGMLALA